ncbi:hypothetical protein Tco_1095722, partial [Tanacetum coccineum]
IFRHVKQCGGFMALTYITCFPPVERLPFHLPNEQSVIFDETESLDYTLDNAVRGAMDWDDFKEFDGVVYPKYKDVCYARGLLEDDKEYIDGLLEASNWGMGNYLRSLFVMLIMSDSMSRHEVVYEKTWHVMVADVLNIKRIKRNDQ